MEQQFKMRRIEDALKDPGASKEDIITLFLALQRQCFTLCNNVSNLVSKWPTSLPNITPEDLSKFGISSETNDSTTI
jgi:hypothetical protein